MQTCSVVVLLNATKMLHAMIIVPEISMISGLCVKIAVGKGSDTQSPAPAMAEASCFDMKYKMLCCAKTMLKIEKTADLFTISIWFSFIIF